MKRPAPLNPIVVGLFLTQVIGWIVLMAMFDHTDTGIVGWVSHLPEGARIALLPFAVVALPAVILAVVLGFALSIIGIDPASIPAILLVSGDVLGLLSAYLLAIGAALFLESMDRGGRPS